MASVGLRISREHYDEMIRSVQAAFPFEGCGLLAGKEGKTTQIYPVDNILQSPVAYEMDPLQQIEAMIEIENQGLDLLAIYHSHPAGPATPSATDVERAFYPESLYVIISIKQRAKPITRAFRIVEGVISEGYVLVE